MDYAKMYSSPPITARREINAKSSPSQRLQSPLRPVVPIATEEQELSFPYPACWRDDQRMGVLMAPFRERSVNVEHYDTKMKFWQELIAEYCEHKGDATFCKRELKMVFAHGERLPAGLDTVLQDLQHRKRIRVRAEFEYDPENCWTGWAVNSFVRRPLNWGFNQLKYHVGLADESSLSATLKYVHLEVMKLFCKQLQTKVLQPQQGKLLHYEGFKELCTPQLNYTEDCLRLCLHTLHCQHKIGLDYKDEEGERQLHLIKIPSKGNVEKVQITEADRAVHNLQITQQSLLKQLESLEEDIKLNESKAREYIKADKRQLAKTYLRKKLLLEKNHEKRSVALHNIETLLCSVDEAHSNGEILDAYNIGSKALQKALNASGLKFDNVDEVLSDVRESMETHKELQDTLANTTVADAMSNYDNDELERELQQIMGETATPKSSVTIAPQTNNNNNNKVSNLVQLKTSTVVTNAANTGVANNNKPPVTAQSTSQPQIVTISDAELLAMLEDLEVADDTVTESSYDTIRNGSTLTD